MRRPFRVGSQPVAVTPRVPHCCLHAHIQVVNLQLLAPVEMSPLCTPGQEGAKLRTVGVVCVGGGVALVVGLEIPGACLWRRGWSPKSISLLF